jgi:hypothetical protein
MWGRNQVGATCSTYPLLTYEPLAAQKPARSRLSPGLFPLPKMCPGETILGSPSCPYMLAFF